MRDRQKMVGAFRAEIHIRKPCVLKQSPPSIHLFPINQAVSSKHLSLPGKPAPFLLN